MNHIDLPMDAVIVKADHAVTTSLRVAEIFGKQHKNVLRDIHEIIAQVTDKFSQLNFEPAEYTDAQGKSRPMFQMTRNGFTMLVMGFAGRAAMAFKEAFIERFDVMEAQLHGPATLGLAIPPVLSLGEYLETRASLNELRTELDVLFNQLEQVDVRCKPAEVEAMREPYVPISKHLVRTRDLVAMTDAHSVPRKAVENLLGINNNNLRQHAIKARQDKPL